jgi:hypothetical protein
MLSSDVSVALGNAAREAADWGVREISPIHMLSSILRSECLATHVLREADVDRFELRDALRAGGAGVGGDASGEFEIGDAGRTCMAIARQNAEAEDREVTSIDLAVALLRDESVSDVLARVGLDSPALAAKLARTL